MTNTVGASEPFGENATTESAPADRSASTGSGVKASVSSGGDGFALGDASLKNRLNGSAMSSAGGLISTRLSRNDGTRTSTLRRNAAAREASAKLPALAPASNARYCSSTTSGHIGANIDSALIEALQPRSVAAFGGQARLLQEHGQITRAALTELVQQLLCVGISVGSARPFDFLRERVAGTQTGRIELNRATEIGDALVETAARGFELTLKKRNLAARRRQRRRSLNGSGRGIELAEPQVRQGEIGPRRRLARNGVSCLRKVPFRIVQQADFERRQAAVERADEIFIGWRIRCGQAIRAPDHEIACGHRE